MGTAICILGFGTILFWLAIIILLIILFSKNKELCEGIRVLYFWLTCIYAIFCAIIGFVESLALSGSSQLLQIFFGTIWIFLVLFSIANIPSLILRLIYKNKFSE